METKYLTLITGIFLVSIILGIMLIIPIGQAQNGGANGGAEGETQTEFDLETTPVKDWHKNWEQIKADLFNSDLRGSAKTERLNAFNEKWKAASDEDRLATLKGLINTEGAEAIDIDSLASSDLSFDFKSPTLECPGCGQEIALSIRDEQGKPKAWLFLNRDTFPPNLKKIEYKKDEKGFLFSFKDNRFVELRTGTLGFNKENSKFIISGTGWPSENLEWDGRGEFIQTAEEVELRGNAVVTVGNLEITRARKSTNIPGKAVFLAGDEGNSYVKGTNLDVSVRGKYFKFKLKEEHGILGNVGQIIYIKEKEKRSFLDFWAGKGTGYTPTKLFEELEPVNQIARVITPIDKATEVILGGIRYEDIPPTGNQYVIISPGIGDIKIKGDGISTEIFTGLQKLQGDGTAITVKNGDVLYKFEGEKTLISHLPGKSNSVDEIVNVQDPDRKYNSIIKVKVIEAIAPAGPIEPAEPQTSPDPTESTPPREQPDTPQQPTETEIQTTTESKNGRVRHVFTGAGQLEKIELKEGDRPTMDAGFTISDQDNERYKGSLSQLPDESPRRLDLVSKLNIETADVLMYLKEEGRKRLKLPGQGRHITRSDLVSRLSELPPSVINGALPSNKQIFTPGNIVTIKSGGAGSGTATVEIWDESAVITRKDGSRVWGPNPYHKKVFSGEEAEAVIKYVNNRYKEQYNQ